MTTQRVIYEGVPTERDFFDALNFHRTLCSPEIGARQDDIYPSPGIVTTRYKVNGVSIRYDRVLPDEQGETPRRVRVTLEGEGNVDEIAMKIRDAEEKTKKASPQLGLVGALTVKH